MSTDTQTQVQQAEARLSMYDLLNKITLDNIALVNSIGLGDVIYRLAVAIQRSGSRFNEVGQCVQQQVNKDIAQSLFDFINQYPRTIDHVPVNIGFDPARPFFMEGEAYSLPINGDMVMLLGYKKGAPAIIQMEGENKPTSVDGRIHEGVVA